MPGMLVLSTLRKYLSVVLSPPTVHTAALFTPPGQLVASTSTTSKSKDEIRVLVGLSMEVWEQGRAEDMGMAECELGKIVVIPLYRQDDLANGRYAGATSETPIFDHQNGDDEDFSGASGAHTPFHFDDTEPLLLLALQGSLDADWDDLSLKARSLAQQLVVPLSRYGERLLTDPPLPPVRAPK